MPHEHKWTVSSEQCYWEMQVVQKQPIKTISCPAKPFSKGTLETVSQDSALCSGMTTVWGVEPWTRVTQSCDNLTHRPDWAALPPTSASPEGSRPPMQAGDNCPDSWEIPGLQMMKMPKESRSLWRTFLFPFRHICNQNFTILKVRNITVS